MWNIIIVIVYLYAGYRANRWYQKKLDILEKRLIEERKIEFSYWKVSFWSFLMFFFWWFVLLYERFTNWHQWIYPYCLPQGAPKGWDKEPAVKFRAQEEIISSAQISGETLVAETKKRINKLENASNISPGLLDQTMTI